MRPEHPLPVVLVVGLTSTASAAAGLAVQCDLPGAVVVRHDFADGRLHRVVSDLGGVLEREVVELEHGCLSCALREDVVPTLLRLAEAGRWRQIVGVLPPTVDPLPVCRMLGHGRHAGRAIGQWLELRSVLAAVDVAAVVPDVMGDDLLSERGWSLAPDDLRSVGEAVTAQIEFADHLVAVSTAEEGVALLGHLARPTASLLPDPSALTADLVLTARDDAAAHAAVDPRCRVVTGATDTGSVASRQLSSWKPFHPTRLHDRLADLAPAGLRVRGCFWLPGRPQTVQAWDHAGGQLSIGSVGSWFPAERGTRLVATGHPALLRSLRDAFETALMSDAEMTRARGDWAGRPDGFEDWLDEEWPQPSAS